MGDSCTPKKRTDSDDKKDDDDEAPKTITAAEQQMRLANMTEHAGYNASNFFASHGGKRNMALIGCPGWRRFVATMHLPQECEVCKQEKDKLQGTLEIIEKAIAEVDDTAKIKCEITGDCHKDWCNWNQTPVVLIQT